MNLYLLLPNWAAVAPVRRSLKASARPVGRAEWADFRHRTPKPEFTPETLLSVYYWIAKRIKPCIFFREICRKRQHLYFYMLNGVFRCPPQVLHSHCCRWQRPTVTWRCIKGINKSHESFCWSKRHLEKGNNSSFLSFFELVSDLILPPGSVVALGFVLGCTTSGSSAVKADRNLFCFYVMGKRYVK